MATIGYILLAIAILPYIAVPFLIWKTQRFSPSFQLRLIQETFVPALVLQEFESLQAPLVRRDFEKCFDAVATDDFLGLRFYHRILINRLLKTWAVCTAICDPEGTLQKSYLELKSEISNKGVFSTHNSELIGAPITSRHRKAIGFPVHTQPNVLLNIHLRHLDKMLAEVVEPNAETAESTFKAFLAQDHEEQVELGAIYFDESEKVYRPTWAGAFLIGWYSMWPLTFMRRFISALRVRAMSKEVLTDN